MPAQGFGRLEYFRGARTVARLSHDLLGCDWLWCLGARVVGFLSKADGPATSGCSRQQCGIHCLRTCARPCARVAAARCAAAGECQPLGGSAALQAFARRGPALKRPKTRLWYLPNRVMQECRRARGRSASVGGASANILARCPPACLDFFACDFRKWQRTSVYCEHKFPPGMRRSPSRSRLTAVIRNLRVSLGTAPAMIAGHYRCELIATVPLLKFS